jgi:hypothetical protein
MKMKEKRISRIIGVIIIFNSLSIETYTKLFSIGLRGSMPLLTKIRNKTTENIKIETDKLPFLNFGKYKIEKIFKIEMASDTLKKAIK